MSTAHRPTWNSALGSDSQGGSLRGPVSAAVSSKDLNMVKNLNYRKSGQGTVDEQKKLEISEKNLN
jgi:hypothetical protein